MGKFKVGDRVKFMPIALVNKNIMRNKDLINSTGTIIFIDSDESYSISVEWDNNINGHDCSRMGRWGHCLFMAEAELYLVDTKIYPRDKIKDGDFVKSRDGEVGFVRNHCIYYGLDAIKVSFYDRNLYNDVDMDYDIMTIYRADEVGNIDVVWERYEYTEDEIQIAKLIADKVKYIARDDDGELVGYKEKPVKDVVYSIWSGHRYYLNVFDDYFPNIKFQDDEPVSIDDILEFER